MEKRNIIVIGASAGGFLAIRKLVSDLPSTLDAAVFIVWHIAPFAKGVLPDVLNKHQSIYAAHAIDKEPVVMNRIYVAPPDKHLMLENGKVRVTNGPKENMFRPAIDPLFRSAALAYGPRVIGVVLSGALDDGTTGLWIVKEFGGLAVVQDPADAEVPSMPESAIRAVQVDYKVPVAEMGSLLQKLCNEEVSTRKQVDSMEKEKTQQEVLIALQDNEVRDGVMQFGSQTAFTCPECHGALTALLEGSRMRYRCHTGHAYSADSLLVAVTEKIEDSLWSAIRNMQESVMLLNHMGDHFAEDNQPKLAAKYFVKAREAGSRESLVRQAVLKHENLSNETISQQDV